MTIWDNIYQNYKKTGEEYATLKGGLIPEFIDYVNSQNFKLKKVLDIGCGNGKYLAYLKSLGFQTDGIDSSPTAVDITKSSLNDNSNILCEDMFTFQLPQDQYGLILSIAAIHHGLKTQVRNAIKNLYGSLVKGGHIFITLPDNEGSTHWTMMSSHKEIEPGTRIPQSGPEKGLPHSAFTKSEIEEMFHDFKNLNLVLLADRGRWIITGDKE